LNKKLRSTEDKLATQEKKHTNQKERIAQLSAQSSEVAAKYEILLEESQELKKDKSQLQEVCIYLC
jgi:hypothetical protein